MRSDFVTEAFEVLHEQEQKTNEAERDNLALHVSDLPDCPRAVWARRNGKALLAPDHDTLRKFAYGNDFEARVGRALTAAGLVYTSQQPVQMGKSVGHPDFVVETNDGRVVIEVKTTTFFMSRAGGVAKRIVPTEPKLDWCIQAASYARTLECREFIIVVCCRESGGMVEFRLQTAQYLPMVLLQYKKHFNVTKPGTPEPVDAMPPEFGLNIKTGKYWRCSYCAYTGCEKNVNPAALVVPA